MQNQDPSPNAATHFADHPQPSASAFPKSPPSHEILPPIFTPGEYVLYGESPVLILVRQVIGGWVQLETRTGSTREIGWYYPANGMGPRWHSV